MRSEMGKGLSVHGGLNGVDPVHQARWVESGSASEYDGSGIAARGEPQEPFKD
jgi:hypothetical protein